mmetsp:Transcript_3752/g.6932  ORF Transcript_3752/g.6932 Transcript_3752/m.6932 type:complete len:130 (-) Transcript_3752:137-526(-)
MLLVARERLPGEAWQSDMRTVSLNDSSSSRRRSVLWEQVDAVTCLFSSIGYLPDTGALMETAKSLPLGGAELIEPSIQSTSFIAIITSPWTRTRRQTCVLLVRPRPNAVATFACVTFACVTCIGLLQGR